MKKRFRNWLLALSLAFVLKPVAAENLMDIVQLAQENDPTLKAAAADHQAAQEAVPLARSLFLPGLNADASYGKQSQDVTSSAFDRTGTFVSDNQNYALTLRQTIFNMQSILQYRRAKVNVRQADAQWELAQQNFLLRVAEAYFGVLAAQEQLQFARAEKNAIARQLEQAKQRFEVGLIAITDVHEAQARYDLSVAREIAAENDLATAREALREITGQLHQNLLQLGTDMPLVPPTPTNIEEWTQAAEDQNLSLIVARQAVDAARLNTRLQKAQRYPQLGLSGSYAYFDRGGAFAQAGNEAAVTLDLTMNIYQGGFISSSADQARFQAESTQWNRERVEREVLRGTRDAYLGVLAAISHVKALRQALTSAESALAATEAGFEVGTRTAVDVLDAQRELFRARLDYAQSRYDYILNTLRLKLAVGMLTLEDVRQVNTWLQ